MASTMEERAVPMSRLERWRLKARRLKRWVMNLLAHLQDASRFARGSGLLRDRSTAAVKAQVLKTAHRLDKGLALPQPRTGFGSQAARLLHQQMKVHLRVNGCDWAWLAAQSTLARHAQYLEGVPAWSLSETMSAQETRTRARGEFPALVRARRSVRQFAPGAIPEGVLERASELAAMSPSACNRSGARVWVATETELRRRVLSFQDGHQGFGEQAAAVAVISVDTSVFHTVEERHQAWVDGGLFAMTYIYALHHEGLGTCCLNWCVSHQTDREFKRCFGLPSQDAVVMLLAIGPLPDHYTVAHSPRRPLSEVLRSLEVVA